MIAPRPLVVGYPRSGFSLLISVIAELVGPARDRRTLSIKALCDTAGFQISRRIEDVFMRRGLSHDLIYNYNFRQLAGGPKWLAGSEFRDARFRKYIGLRGGGDFTLITSHPREILNYYEVVHSHVGPAAWLSALDVPKGLRFASMRHPAGTLTSACFSINALASEYIQRFVPCQEDNDFLRQRLALYKLSDLNFFEALLPPFKAYLEEFTQQDHQYYLMRWEDLIDSPVKTILGIADELGCGTSVPQAQALWAKLDHVNLTGAHKHNLRRGHGIVEGWKGWITNTHLDILRDHGIEKYAVRYGYGPMSPLDESAYTPFQQMLEDYIRRGEVFRDYGDEDLFGFAFNKSNIDFSRFGFRQYPWRTHTSIERSSCRDESLVMEVSDVAEEACGIFNEAASIWIDAVHNDDLDSAMIDSITPVVSRLYDNDAELASFVSAMTAAVNAGQCSYAGKKEKYSEPLLLDSVGTTNIVLFQGKYYAVPQALGPVDFSLPNLSGIAFTGIADSFSELILMVNK
ncbi:hypothetical protein QLH52_01520 [Methylomonas sp. OY6]|uniref:Sulfotransferase family protein n=1 Tax=Methylomonas defluvii TaxID=3045149 RepID=A0ABU4U9C6_9GAMM|nr:hypothetical protein [Methylomonas sp. OY6]MDX8125949.1 hypothetical protein [Methylomonas sp. OY6]